MSLSRRIPIQSGRPFEPLDAPHEARLIDLWDAWLFAAADASLALGDWTCAADAEKSDAYSAYQAALDREEQAAVVLERRSSPLGPVCAAEERGKNASTSWRVVEVT
jgi:hypothetical protein